MVKGCLFRGGRAGSGVKEGFVEFLEKMTRNVGNAAQEVDQEGGTMQVWRSADGSHTQI